ncbi:microcompartments protein [Alkaliphilus metalliredigens QYMF]|uniref:Microcompartments protein n=1 Tax=Alkaliphilus metalliredigens (strain QYMF) TaxID=293826 RepID=A6TUS9_ALKMQ|nr:BMC domain-containing protein [Alkaliphilus metalliredigens]ABR49947.1 microcompartments protein [Alkaliphilus metalliredigens QYMF]
MELKIIKSPTKGTLDILNKRLGLNAKGDILEADALGLMQGKMIDMIHASDIAEKTAGVMVSDINGSCPQNMIMIAIWGDTSSVESAFDEIKRELGKEKTYANWKTH